jgi:transcriptional regulator with XRE-family HTH domain
MVEPTPFHVGMRIRALREQRGLSLRALAERCGLSINAISLIERGENSPTVSSLQVLAAGLGVKITDFFEEASEHAVVYVRRDRRLRSQGNGVVMESLGIGLRNQQLEPFLVTIDPSATQASDLIAHPGQEFAYCVEGEVEYRIGQQSYTLLPGDSLLFDAAQPHCFRNTGERPATILLVFQASAGGHLARQYHFDS